MRLLIPTLLVVLAAMTACGPREGQASNDAEPPTPRGSGTSVTTVVESVPSKPESVRQPIHPMAAAAAKAHMDDLLAKRAMLESELDNE